MKSTQEVFQTLDISEIFTSILKDVSGHGRMCPVFIHSLGSDSGEYGYVSLEQGGMEYMEKFATEYFPTLSFTDGANMFDSFDGKDYIMLNDTYYVMFIFDKKFNPYDKGFQKYLVEVSRHMDKQHRIHNRMSKLNFTGE